MATSTPAETGTVAAPQSPRWSLPETLSEDIISADEFARLPGHDVPEIAALWRAGLHHESNDRYLEAGLSYQRIAERVGNSSSPYWRQSRNYWRHAESLAIEQKEERIEFFVLADGAASRGLEIDDECAECMLWKYAALGRLATTRGLITAARDAATMARLLDRGIALQPTHRDDDYNTTLGNLYYASATFYRMVPDWFWLKWLVGVRGDKERAIRDARSAVALAQNRVDYQIELGASLLCYGNRKQVPGRVVEGQTILKRAIDLPHVLPTDAIDQGYARILILQPEKACGFSRDGFIDVEAVGKQL